MKTIDIRITKARIKSFNIELKNDLPEVTATIELLTENEKKISTFTASTISWYGDMHFDLPAVMIPSIKKIAQKLEDILINTCNNSLMLLEHKE